MSSHDHAAALTLNPDGTFTAVCGCGWTSTTVESRKGRMRDRAVGAGIAAGDHLTDHAVRGLAVHGRA